MRRLLLSLTTAMALAAPAHADNVAVADLPGEVVLALQKQFRNAILLEAARQRGDDGPYYQVSLRHEGQQHAVAVSPDGRILRTQR